MTWWAIDVRAPAGRQEAVGAWLVARTGQAVEERSDGTLVAIVPAEDLAWAVLDELAHTGNASVETAPRPFEPVDWSVRWRDGLGVRQVHRLTITPSWVPQASDYHPLNIVLDPETAFGSGEHGSTRVALTLLGQLPSPANLVLDLGSGSGILAIAAVKLGASRAIGIEVDAEANEVAGRNAARNGVGERVEFLEGDAAVLAALLGPVDLVLSNILRSVNTTLLPVIRAVLRPGGRAIFSGIEDGEAIEFRRTLTDSGLIIVQEAMDSGWWGVATQRAP
jgi:ribosomal protein L11 methyltransferase